jgi:uncharacterized protein
VKALKILSFVLVVVGALNWGLVGFFQFDLVAAVLGNASLFSRTVYALVGVAALYQLANMKSVLE